MTKFKTVDLHCKSNDFDVGPKSGDYKAVLTYKEIIKSDYPHTMTYKLFTYDYANLIINITSDKTGVSKNFTYVNRFAHPPNYEDNHCVYEYWFSCEEKDIIAVFYVNTEI